MSFADVLPLFAALVIGLLLGLERERAHGRDNNSISLGVRTITILSLTGAFCALIANPSLTMVVGFTVGGLLISSYVRKFVGSKYKNAGLTSEFTATASFLLGYLAYTQSQLAVIASIIILTLLVLKDEFHRFARRKITNKERSAAVIFLVISLVVLPLLPERAIDPFGIFNPQKLWLIFVFIVGIEFASYIALRFFKGRWGLFLSGIFGGLVSSTATALSLTKHLEGSKKSHKWPVLCALTLSEIASLVMQFSLIVILVPQLFLKIAPVFLLPIIVLLAITTIIYFTKIHLDTTAHKLTIDPGNPMTLKRSVKFALTIALVLLGVSLITHLFDQGGLFASSFLGGLVSARAVIVALSEVLNASLVTAPTAMIAIIVAMVSNAIFKASIIARSKDAQSLMIFIISMGLAISSAVVAYYLVTSGVFVLNSEMFV